MIKRGIGRLRRIVRRRRNRSGSRILILLYHRVNKLRSDPWSLAVTPDHFAEHLEILRQHARPVRLQQLSQALLDSNSDDRSVIVTFDDGYADNLHNAKPALERYAVPATVFLTTGYIGGEREFWWDELDRLLLQPGTLPETLMLSIGGSSYRWKLGKAAHYSENASRHRPYRKTWDSVYRSRHRLYYSLWELLHPLAEGDREKVLDELLAWAGAEPAGRSTHRPLSHEEAAALCQGGLIEGGAHTVTHPALSTLPPASQRNEILESKARLEEVLGRAVTSFAYPHGGRHDYTPETVGIVREAGFTCACTSFAGVVERSNDRFQLPRLHVQDWDGEEFAKQLSRWFRD